MRIQMNKKEREELQKITDDLQCMQEVEKGKCENAPENLQYSERYEHMQEIADNLQEAIDLLTEILEG